MGGGKEKNLRNSLWVGKHRILVKSHTFGFRSEWFVADLKQNKILMKHPQVLWSDNVFESTAVLHKGTLSVLNFGVENFTNRNRRGVLPIIFPVYEKTDYIHSSDVDTCVISTLDLKITPPKWSNWTPGPKLIFRRESPLRAALDNNIFAFRGTMSDFKNPEVYRITGGSSDDDDDKWEEITTIPFTPDHPAWLSIQPISDPKNKRLIAYFNVNNTDNDNSLYAYHPNHDNDQQWLLLHQHISDPFAFNHVPSVADQVVVDNLILCFYSHHPSFMAYDISANKWLKVVDSDDFVKFLRRKMYFGAGGYVYKLVHLGNDILCLATTRCSKSPHTVLQFLRFTVQLVQNDSVQLTSLSFHSISVRNIRCLANTFIPF